MKATCWIGCLILMNGACALASEAGPVSQAWAVRIDDGPTDPSLLVSGMAVGPSGDVFLVGPFRSGGYYLRDILITRHSSSGAMVWKRSYEPPEGPSANEWAVGIVAHGTNVYVGGSITTTNGRTDFLTLKYRDTGELEWAVRSERPISYSTPTAIAVDGQGNVLVLSSAVDVLKYGPNGNLLWTYSYDGAARPAEMRVDAGGNIYVAGTTGPSYEEMSPVTLKLDPNGHELWRAHETSTILNGGTANGLDVDSAGNVVTVARDMSYGMIWKYDANGNRQWMARYRAEEPAPVYAADVRFDASGNIIVFAELYGDNLLIKYAADGQQLWASRIFYPNGPSWFDAFDLDSAGNSYLSTSPAGYDVVTVKVNPDGVQLWSMTYNSQGAVDDAPESIKVTPSGDIFLAIRSFHMGENFVSLVKYTQQPATGLATAVVTPALQVVDPGTNVVLTAQTIGPGPMGFQWRKNGRSITEATNITLSLSNVQAVDRADYSVIVSNQAGATVSPEARLSVRVPPEVFIAPAQTLAYVGTDAAFAATVSGNDFATLQWRHNGTNIPGATNQTFRLFNLKTDASGSYDIVVTTFGGSTTSSAAGLTISRAVELIGTTPHRSAYSSYEYQPRLAVLPNGESLIVARSNHLMGSNIVLDKRAPNGELLWTSVFESTEFTNAEPSSLLLDGAGNIFISGRAGRSYYPDALAVLKYNPDGQLLWSRFLTGTNIGGTHAFAVDPQGNSVIASLGGYRATATRYNHAGDIQWTFVNPLPEDDSIEVALDASGNSYLGTTIVVEGYNAIRLRKFDSKGAIVWTGPDAQGPHSRLGALAVDGEGHLIVAGVGEPPAGTGGFMFVQKYSSGGQKLWETRTGSSWGEVTYIVTLAVGPGNDITVLNMSDDDYEPREECAVTRIGPDGQLKYRTKEPQILVWHPPQLALDNFGNAYVTGWGGRVVTGVDAVTAKYDAYGTRHWLVYYDGPQPTWQYSVAVGADAAGEVRVLAIEDTGSDSGSDYNYSLLHYRQRDPAGTFRLQLIADAGGTFHLTTPTQEPFRIEASADLQSWDLLTEEETQQLLQPGATSFADSPKRFFRLILAE